MSTGSGIELYNSFSKKTSYQLFIFSYQWIIHLSFYKKILLMKKFILPFFFIICSTIPLNTLALSISQHSDDNLTHLINQGDTFFQQGNFSAAIKSWEKSLALDSTTSSQRVDLLTRLAAAYQAIGMHKQVFKKLGEAMILTKQTQDVGRNALVLSQLSDAWLTIGDSKEALSVAKNAVQDAKLANESSILARALNSQGNALTILQQYPEALVVYKESEQVSIQTGDILLAIKALINQVNAALKENPLYEVITLLDEAGQFIEQLPNNHDKAASLISYGTLALQLLEEDKVLIKDKQFAKKLLENTTISEVERQFAQKLLQNQNLTPSQKQKVFLKTYSAFSTAAQISKPLQDARTTSIAYGHWGELYEKQQRYAEALTLTRQAIFFAKQANYPHILYRWYWQTGRIFKAQGQLQEATNAYRLASKTLEPIQRVLEVGYRSIPGTFNDMVRPVHYGLADLLLQKAATITYSYQQQSLLKEAMNTVELIKVAELKEYFQDECVLALQSKATGLDQISSQTAILYPIPLHDRLAVLVSISGKIHQQVVPVSNKQVNETAWNLRLRLQTRPHNRFLYQARELYDWLIRPVDALLKQHKVDTLVIVPDGKLRMIPFSTLQDGEHFLIEKYALALSPGMTLLNPHPIRWQDSKLLLVGLSDAVQKYPPLPNVPKELQSIQKISQGIATNDRILNAEYSIETFRQHLKVNEYSVIHMATHGEFDADPKYTYLLTHQEKMTMDKLQDVIGLGRFRDKPLELLTLSACKTAVGDDKAALGLAGVAVKAGARSAIATLWFVDDEATSIAISEFYQQLLKTPGLSKAKALQNVQKKLIAQDRYWHPSYWAPFLLIGNWL
jgi:CHAT domain-containing protein